MKHRNFLKETGLWQTKEAYRLQKDLEALIQDTLFQDWQAKLDPEQFQRVLADLVARKCSPMEAARSLL